jgi:hypothetical protein
LLHEYLQKVDDKKKDKNTLLAWQPDASLSFIGVLWIRIWEKIIPDPDPSSCEKTGKL